MFREKARKNQRSEVEEKWVKIKVPHSKRNWKTSKVCCQRKMGKYQTTAVGGKWDEIKGPPSKKNGKISKVAVK